MRFFNAEALVLDVVDLHDYDRIVVFLTRERGLKRGVARGARRKYSRFGGQLQPLAKVNISWLEKEGRDLARISSVELERSAKALQTDLEGLLLGSYLAEHVMEFAQENEDSELPFRLLDSTLRHLIAGADPHLATRFFEAWMLRLAGVFPAPVDCPQCGGGFSARGAVLPPGGEGLICGHCARGEPAALRVAPAVLDFLVRIATDDLPRLAAGPPAAETLDEVERLCREVRRRFLQHELKSYLVIRDTLAAAPASPRPSTTGSAG